MAHDYQITVDVLHPGGEGTESVSFFVSTKTDLLAEADLLRRQGRSAAHALGLAVGIGLLNQPSTVEPALASVIPIEA